MHLHRVARQFYNRPLLLHRASAETISAFLLTRIGAGPVGKNGEDDAGESVQIFNASRNEDGSVEIHRGRASRFYGDYPVGTDGRPKPYRRTADGTAIVTTVGEFVNRGGYVGASSGIISYEGFKYQMLSAAADDQVRQIVVDQESPGGEAVGAFEAAAVVRQVAAEKPVITVVNGMSCSAAYALASGSSRIITLPTGLSGSIGVVMVHLDFEKYLEDEGIKPTLIFSGDHKVDGNPYEALPKAVRADFQRESDSFYSDFVATVVAGRKNLTEKDVRDTQARVFKGQEAVDAGLVDDVGTFEELLADLQRSPAKGGPTQKGRTMKTISEDDHNAALASARTEAKAEGVAEGKAIGATDTMARFSAILASEDVKGRELAALDLAMKSPSMSAGDVAAFVKANIAPSAAKPGIAERMGNQGALLSLGQATEKPAGAVAKIDTSGIYASRQKAAGA